MKKANSPWQISDTEGENRQVLTMIPRTQGHNSQDHIILHSKNTRTSAAGWRDLTFHEHVL